MFHLVYLQEEIRMHFKQKMATLCAHCPLLAASHKKSKLKHGNPNLKFF
jgi:hypothetical protein